MNRYPVFIPSKGRASSQLTARNLEKMKIPFFVVIEPCDYKNYLQELDKTHILVLPFENLGQGSIPARNWIWDYAREMKVERFWCIDDNIKRFCRLQMNRRITCRSSGIIRAAEDFVDRYENIALSGFHYTNFVHGLNPNTMPFILNTRIYSMILIKTDIPYSFRGRYNEDADLSIRVLKDGWCTLLFQAFLQDKTGTQIMSGGNTDNVYNTGDYRLEFAKSLQDQHPDVTQVTWKFNRWHHLVDYSPFKRNKLILKDGLIPTKNSNEYGMVLRRKKPSLIKTDTDRKIEWLGG